MYNFAKISCIIPTCDREELLVQTLESVLNQTKRADEIIVVDNGKSDVHLPSKFNDHVKMVRLPPGAGVSRARNTGAKAATHEMLAFIDDDDLWEQKYLERATSAFEDGADCAVSRLDRLIDGKILPYKNAAGLVSTKNILMFNPGITGSNLVVKKNIFLSVGGYDEALPPSEDKSLVLDFLLKGSVNIVVLPHNQAIQRWHDRDRLTNPYRLAIGIDAFTKKYRGLMDTPTYLFNRWKYFKARVGARNKIAFIGLITYWLAYRLAKLFYRYD